MEIAIEAQRRDVEGSIMSEWTVEAGARLRELATRIAEMRAGLWNCGECCE